MKDNRITKRRVTMTNIVAIPGGYANHVAIDHVKPEFLDTYVEDARKRWQLVEVSEEPDAGPGGYEGQTFIPARISESGQDVTLAAEKGK